jgi:hypothetical protein
MSRIVEFRVYTLRPGARAEFHALVVRHSIPMLARWKVDVVGYGPSLHDEVSYFLVRAYRSLDERRESQDAFYGSAEWREGPRDPIVALIETYTTAVVELSGAAVANLRESLATHGQPPGQGDS